LGLSDRVSFAAVAAASIATVAIGLRVGAGDWMRAAIVTGAPLPRGGGRAAWQLRTQTDDLHSRTALETPFVATVRARGVERVVRGTTDADGVAELPFDAPGLATGDTVELDVRDARGAVLARGRAAWPKAPLAEGRADARLRASRDEGALRMRVAVLGGALAPGQAGRVWITTTSNGEPPRDVHVDATPDLGVDLARAYVASTDPACARTGVVELVARGMSGGLALHAKDALGREGDWYGGLPVAAGAMHVNAPTFAPAGPVRVVVESASARTLAYVEVDDDVGRVAGAVLPLTGAPPRAESTFDLADGKYFVVVSGEPDGAEHVAGATRALPLVVGPNAPCEAELAEIAATSFPRFVALDGFVEKRAALAARHRRGRLVALLGLVLGSFLETLLLLRAARAGRQRMRQLQNAIIAEGESAEAVAPRRDALDVLLFVGLGLLGFVLLFALVASFATK